ncbi:MAG: phosphoribosylformylglycinamidine synthase subunit PurS [Acidobacteria bacterium]|nr:phosphoribosylformylglycinamidine synthase subunit PurS [Acidobacteriota bacterium]
MRAKVYVTLKSGVLDPQGKAVQGAIRSLGHAEVLDVRQGKYFEIRLTDSMSRERAGALLDELAKTVLSNGVIENYRVELEG